MSSADEVWRRLLSILLRLHSNVLQQWDILEKRLAISDQRYIALGDRPTVADISYFPFAMPWMFKFLNVDIASYPNIKSWGERMAIRPAVKIVLKHGPEYGH